MSLDDPESARQFVDDTKTSVAVFSHRFRVDPDELAQDVAVEWLTTQRNTEAQIPVNGTNRHVIENRHAYIDRLTSIVANRIATGVVWSVERSAIRQYRTDLDTCRAENGRDATSAEQDRIAQNIIASGEPGRRAPSGFHRSSAMTHTMSLEAGFGDGTTFKDTLADDELDYGPDFTEGTIGREAEEIRYDTSRRGRDNTSAQRRLVWNAIAEKFGAPTAAPGSVSERKARRGRKDMHQAGGVAAVISRWAEGHDTPELFVPFGNVDPGGEADVVAVLKQHPAYADDMWGAALTAATNERSENRKD